MAFWVSRRLEVQSDSHARSSGYFEHEAPEFDVVAVDGARAFAGGEDECFELEEACLGAVGIDALGAGFGVTELAEAGSL